MKTESIKINDLEIRVTKFGARHNALLLTELGALFGEGALQAVEALMNDGEVSELGRAVHKLFMALPPKTFDDLINRLLKKTIVIGENGVGSKCTTPAEIDLAFGDDLTALMAACAYSLKVNLAPFLQQGFAGLLDAGWLKRVTESVQLK